MSVALIHRTVYQSQLCFPLQQMLNITNNNFATVQTYNLSVQALTFDTVVGTVFIKNVTSVKALSTTTVSYPHLTETASIM